MIFSILFYSAEVIRTEVKSATSTDRRTWSEAFSARINGLKDKNRFKTVEEELIIKELKDKNLEILNSIVDHDAVVWFWCKSQKSMEEIKLLYETSTLTDHLCKLGGQKYEFRGKSVTVNMGCDQLRTDIGKTFCHDCSLNRSCQSIF